MWCLGLHKVKIIIVRLHMFLIRIQDWLSMNLVYAGQSMSAKDPPAPVPPSVTWCARDRGQSRRAAVAAAAVAAI